MSRVLFACLFAMLAGHACAATAPADPRMAEKITYAGGYKRLHQVTEDLAKLTGVSIRCGTGKDDWRVRDIPVVVCAHEVTLSRLLQGIADGTHTVLTCSNVGGVRSYKLWKNARIEKLFQKCEEAKRKFAEAQDRWMWEGLAQLSQVPNSTFDFNDHKEFWEEVLKDARDMSPVIAYLGRTGLDRIYSGEQITLTVRNAPQSLREPILRLGRRAWDKRAQGRRKLAEQNPLKLWNLGDMPGQDLEGTYLSLFLADLERPTVVAGTAVVVDSTEGNWLEIAGGSSMLSYTELIRMAKPGVFPKPPEQPDVTKAAQDTIRTDTHNLRALQSKESWDLPFLKAKVKLEKRADKKETPFKDAVTATADACGFTIVCEDFLSHMDMEECGDLFGGEHTVADLLKKMRRIVWFADPEAKLIVGWSSSWVTDHPNLVPESVLSSLAGKLDRDGVELDDFAPVSHWTFGQQWLWLRHNRWLRPVGLASFNAEAKELWEMYDLLSAEDKALAKSQAGLPLAKLDRDMLSAKFKEVTRHWAGGPRLAFMDESRKREKYELPTDPDAISHLSLRIIKRTPDVAFLPDPEDKGRGRLVETPRGFPKHEYRMEVFGEVDGRQVRVEVIGPSGIYFPAYSPEREKELGKQKQNAKPSRESK